MKTLNLFIKGNYTLVWSILFYLIGVYCTLKNLPIPIFNSHEEGLFPGIDQWIPYPGLNVIVNALLVVSVAILLLRLNNLFTIIPKRTLLPLIFFLLLELATPKLSLLCNGNLMAVVMIAILFLLFFSYQQNQAQSAFLIMGCISVCTLFCPPIAHYIPLLLLGFLQVQYFSLKSVLGALVGIITPFWILIGLGILSLADFTLIFPILSPQIPETIPYTHPQFWVIVLTVILGLFSCVTTIYATTNEKRQIRSYNGFIALLLVYTITLLLLDYSHYTIYLPILHVAVALHAAFFFTNNTKKIGFILFYLVLTLYIGLFAWSCWLT